MGSKKIQKRLASLYETAPTVPLSEREKWVIVSDLHMGNGKGGDDFRINADLFANALEKHYLRHGFGLVLNGDVEELLRFSRKAIARSGKKIYHLFDAFKQRHALIKIFGNHDYELHLPRNRPRHFPVQETLKFGFHGQTIFILHGYQASFFLELFRFLIALSLRFLAQPLHIRNYSVARSSSKKFAIEKKIYEFARQRKIIALIGHTHRPLFESLSKRDSLKFHIEQLCRLYPRADGQQKAILEKQIKQAREELQDLVHRKEGAADSGSLYASEPLVPCLFNSGCAIGKKGITALEFEAGSIRLVYWFDSEREPRHFESRGSPPEALAGTPYCRLVLQEEPLDYLFTRIRLLA